MAVPARKPEYQRKPASERHTISPSQRLAVHMYAAGKERRTVARVLAKTLIPVQYKKDRRQAMRRVCTILKRWEDTQWFRDAIYDASINRMDIGIPQILNGITKKAKQGRVDAARLALEVTGRHSMREGSMAPAVVNIHLQGIPRPQRTLGGIPQDAEVELDAEDADYELMPSTEDMGQGPEE